MYSKARSHQLTNVNKSALASADYVNKSGEHAQQQTAKRFVHTYVFKSALASAD
jgi:hypothetical protein